LDGAVARSNVTAIARRVDRSSVRLSTLAMQRMEQELPWFASMTPEVRSSVGLLVQGGIRGFAEWLGTPKDAPRITTDVFSAAPREMARLVSLQQTVELVRVAVEVTEESVGELATPAEQAWLREATLRFSREVAFAAALVYARAAEQRGAWDARLESLVVDAIVRGEVNDAEVSRAAALGWSQPQAVMAIAGSAGDADPEFLVEEAHARGSGVGADVLAAVQAQRLVVLIGSSGRLTRVARAIVPIFRDGPVVTGPVVAGLADAVASCRAAFAGLRAAPGWPDAPRPVAAEALLPEQAPSGDEEACRQLVDQVYRPLRERGEDGVHTVSTFLATGGAIEAAARALYVHPNTVRYRLARASEACGRNINDPRDRYVVQVALTLGRLADGSRL
jgi:DNA-binding PucR family transcriptional regulator